MPIEGTQTQVDEGVLDSELITPEKRGGWQEIQNYVLVLNNAIQELESLPLSSRLLKNTHATLMQGVRGERRCPGELRRSPNWIGGSSLAGAVFIPPYFENLPDLMSDLEAF